MRSLFDAFRDVFKLGRIGDDSGWRFCLFVIVATVEQRTRTTRRAAQQQR